MNFDFLSPNLFTFLPRRSTTKVKILKLGKIKKFVKCNLQNINFFCLFTFRCYWTSVTRHFGQKCQIWPKKFQIFAKYFDFLSKMATSHDLPFTVWCYNGDQCDHVSGQCHCLPGFQGEKVISIPNKGLLMWLMRLVVIYFMTSYIDMRGGGRNEMGKILVDFKFW